MTAAEEALSKACDDLEWDRVVAAVRERCRGPLGERLDRETLPIAASQGDARQACLETKEVWQLLRTDETLPLDGIRDIGRDLDRLERGGALDGPTLRDVSRTLGAGRALRRFLQRERERAPTLHETCSTDPTLDSLQEDLQHSIEPDGALSDSASPELRRLRTEVSNLRGRIVGRLEHMLLQHADIVQDRFHTQRDGRYVIPIRTDAHERLPGIVHGTSGSGATVFVEPRGIVNQGNRLKMAQGELEREEARILAALSERVSDRLPETRALVDALDRADLRSASARLAIDLDAVVVEPLADARLELRNGRHPLLVLEEGDVVANDLSLAAGEGLVLSGPNAGGKTVALKVLGLAALMVRAGLPVPAAEGSVAGFLSPVLTDVGDEQSIAKNLSTFSAHVENLVRVLEMAGGRALVLLDEVATGTDPSEGAALACAVITALIEAGSAVGVTTHYDRLKAMAVEHERLRNASVGFDVAEMAPTFELRPDVPGSSSALAVAARFGMPESVLELARAQIPEQTRTFDALVRQMEERFEALDAERDAVIAERAEAARVRAEVEARAEKLRARDQKQIGEEGAKLRKQLETARAELKKARRALRDTDKHDDAALEAIREQLGRASATVDAAAPKVASEPLPPAPGDPVDPTTLVVGARVFVPRLRTEVDVVEAPSRGRVRVAAGPVKLWVTLEELRASREQPAEKKPAPKRGPSPAARPPNRDNTVDIRGMRVDDALTMVEGFLDQMYGRSEPVAFVLHGLGSGALRDAVREHTTKFLDQYVRKVRPGTLEEGGEKVTAVLLR